MRKIAQTFSALFVVCALMGTVGTVGASAHTISPRDPAPIPAPIQPAPPAQPIPVQPVPVQPAPPAQPIPVQPVPVQPAPPAQPIPGQPVPVQPAPPAQPVPAQPAQPVQGDDCANAAVVVTGFGFDCYNEGDSDFVVGVQQITNNTTVPVYFHDVDQDQLVVIAPGASQTFNGDDGELMIP